MAVIPTGVLSEPLALAQTLVASTPAFQAWVGAENTAGALASVPLVGVDGPEVAPSRPFCMIAQSGEHEMTGVDSGPNFDAAGGLLLCFEADTAEEYRDSYSDSELSFTNAIGAILQGMWSLSRGPGGHLWMNRLTLMDGPSRSGPVERKKGEDYQQVWYRLSYGVEG